MNFSSNIKWLLWLTSTAILIITPDLTVWLDHTIFVLLHALFEFIEVTLDDIVEHLFHTDRHTTQIIVFYLIWAIVLYSAYRLFRYCKRRVIELKQAIPFMMAFSENFKKIPDNTVDFGNKKVL